MKRESLASSTPASMQPSSSKNRWRMLWIALIALGGVPAIFFGLGKHWSSQAKQQLSSGDEKGIEPAKKAFTTFKTLQYVPFWSHYIKNEQSTLLYNLSSSMETYTSKKLPSPLFKEEAVKLILKLFPTATKTHERRSASDYLYKEGYLTEYLSQLKKADLGSEIDVPFRSAMLYGNFQMARQALTLANPRKGWRTRHFGWQAPHRLSCALGQYGKGMAALKQTIGNPSMELRVGGRSLRPTEAAELLIVQIECAMRVGAYALVKEALPVLSNYGNYGKMMTAYYKARLFQRNNAWEKVSKVILPKLLKENSTHEHHALVAELKVEALVHLKQWDKLLQLQTHWGAWYWKTRKLNAVTLRMLFQRVWAASPERWQRIGKKIRSNASSHPKKDKLLELADDAQTVAALALGLRADPQAQDVLKSIQNPSHKTFVGGLLAKLWRKQTFSKNDLKRIAATPKHHTNRYAQIRYWSYRPADGVQGWQKLATQTQDPKQLEQYLQLLPTDRLIGTGMLLFVLSQRLKYGNAKKLARRKEWQGILSRWQALIRSQPNMVLLQGAKL